MIKKIIFIIIFIVLLMFLYTNQNLKKYDQNMYYELEEVNELKNIDIEANNLVLNIIPTNNKYIKVSRSTVNKKANSIQYSSDYKDGTLIVTEFYNNQNQVEAEDVLTIEIPKNAKLDSVQLNVNNSEVNIESMETKKLAINSTDYLNLTISNSTLTNTKIESDKISSLLTDTLIKNNITYDINQGQVENKNVYGKKEVINNLNETKYINSTSSLQSTVINGANVDMQYLLGGSTYYTFENLTPTKEVEEKLEKVDEIYTYNKDVKGLENYVVECNNNSISTLEIEKKQAITSEGVENE